MKLYIKEFYKEEKYYIEPHPCFKNYFRVRCGLNFLKGYIDNISYWSNNVKGGTPLHFEDAKYMIKSLDSKIKMIQS